MFLWVANFPYENYCQQAMEGDPLLLNGDGIKIKNSL